MAIDIGFDLDAFPTFKRMSLSEALIRLVTGPAGTGKTSYCAMELMRLAMLQEPAADNVRYFRAVVIRNTYQLLRDNTVNTFSQMYGPLYKGTMGTQPRATVAFGLADGTRVEMDIIYLAMDAEDAQSKLLGMETTFFMLDEVSELPESLVFACVNRLGRYPSGAKGRVTRTGIIGATNGPSKNHWLYRWYLGERDEEFERVARQMGITKYVELFQQPPALLRPAPDDPDGEWLPNPKAENIHNLAQGYGYYYAMLGNPDNAKIQSYVEGVFADIKQGRVVFPEFSRDLHVVPAATLRTQELRKYYLSFDFGRTPVCLVGFLSADGRLVVTDEFMGEDMSVDQLYRTIVLPALKERYPHAVCEMATGDPAGLVGGQQLDLSPFDVLRELGVPIRPHLKSNKLEPRLQAVRRFMATIGFGGKPRLMIRDNCKFLINALASDYIYEKKAGSTGFRDEPTKSHVGWVSDLCDSLQYMSVMAIKISEDDAPLPTTKRDIDWGV